MDFIRRYTHWLHTQWPAGKPERLPLAEPDGSTNVPGLYIVGDLTGVPLLKLSMNAGTQVVRRIVNDPRFQRREQRADVLDVAIIGGGTAGFAAAREAQKQGLRYCVFEASEPFFTIVNFPKRKPIYTYPTDLPIDGGLQLHDKSKVKEGLLEDLREQTVEAGLTWVKAKVDRIERKGAHLLVHCPEGIDADSPHPPSAINRSPFAAHRVIVAIGRSGNYRRLNVPGEDLDKVYNRLHDPSDFCGQRVLVVGGGDSAMETAIALTMCGADVTLSYRGKAFNRPKPDNIEKITALAENADAQAESEQPSDPRAATPIDDYLGDRERRGRLTLQMASHVQAIREDAVELERADGSTTTLPNDTVFAMIGREAPLDFFRRSGVRIAGEKTAWWWVTLIGFLLLCVWLYHWKKSGVTIANVPPLTWISQIGSWWQARGWFPYNVPDWWAGLGGAFADPANLLGTLKVSLGEPGFWYSLAYCACVVGFGIARIRRRRTPYVTVQTVTLATIQCIPLFILPYAVLPWMGHNGFFDDGSLLRPVADSLFPVANYGHGREYWRAFGLILAWPLFIWNVFTHEPLWGWLIISVVQTFGLIPLMIYFWGKGAYCGWICSCGALAETMGDRQRHKMPHGAGWNRFNMLGQVFLVFALLLLVFRVAGWVLGDGSWPARAYGYLMNDLPVLNYVWFVDLLWAGILGVGLYFWFSGRVWCRFACPLAALMHIYHRFSRFRILADKSKCISCNVCTTVCHQGIDIMSFANKGEPMADPQCVRCSACVQMCPTGVLSFGQVNPHTGEAIREDPPWLAASPVRMREVAVTVEGKRVDKRHGGTEARRHEG